MALLDYGGLTTSDKQRNLLVGEIPGTTQTYTYSSDGKLVTQVDHKKGTTTIRTDVYTYGETSITEVRTITGIGSLTITTNLETLETSVVFTAA